MEEHRINLTESDFIRGRRLSPGLAQQRVLI